MFNIGNNVIVENSGPDYDGLTGKIMSVDPGEVADDHFYVVSITTQDHDEIEYGEEIDFCGAELVMFVPPKKQANKKKSNKANKAKLLTSFLSKMSSFEFSNFPSYPPDDSDTNGTKWWV